MTLDRCDEIEVSKDSRHIRKALDVMGKEWSESQKQLYKKKLLEGIQKSRSANYIDVLYKQAEENGGRIRDVDQLFSILEHADDRNQNKILRTEIALQKRLHNADYLSKPHLYQINKMSIEDLTKNLTTLLTTDEVSGSESISSLIVMK